MSDLRGLVGQTVGARLYYVSGRYTLVVDDKFHLILGPLVFNHEDIGSVTKKDARIEVCARVDDDDYTVYLEAVDGPVLEMLRQEPYYKEPPQAKWEMKAPEVTEKFHLHWHIPDREPLRFHHTEQDALRYKIGSGEVIQGLPAARLKLAAMPGKGSDLAIDLPDNWANMSEAEKIEYWHEVTKLEDNEMAEARHLYTVYIIDPEGDGKVVLKFEEIIAKNQEAAKQKAAVKVQEGDLEKDYEDYDVLVGELADYGTIRPK